MNDLTTLIQEPETRYSAQLIIATLNEAPGIGLTIAEDERYSGRNLRSRC